MEPRIVRLPLGDNAPTARLYYGIDAIEGLNLLPDASVHMVCTSPPYWGLRDYQTGTWEGGSEDCDHVVDSQSGASKQKKSTLGPNRDGLNPGNAYFMGVHEVYRKVCSKCGAHRIDEQIGLETTPGEYIGNLVRVFREIKRVLRPDGTLWLNLGDSYNSGPSGGLGGSTLDGGTANQAHSNRGWRNGAGRADGKIDDRAQRNRNGVTAAGLKPKDLCGIPWQVAFALQADGWYLRSDIIWAKGNCMPESVHDRPTRSHEYVFLFAHPDSGGRYFYDQDAIREPVVCTRKPGQKITDTRETYGLGGGNTGLNDLMARYHDGDAPTHRNKRSVWSINPKPYPGAHFATWPPELVEIMIKAGSSEKGCCTTCRAPWMRVVERG